MRAILRNIFFGHRGPKWSKVAQNGQYQPKWTEIKWTKNLFSEHGPQIAIRNFSSPCIYHLSWKSFKSKESLGHLRSRLPIEQRQWLPSMLESVASTRVCKGSDFFIHQSLQRFRYFSPHFSLRRAFKGSDISKSYFPDTYIVAIHVYCTWFWGIISLFSKVIKKNQRTAEHTSNRVINPSKASCSW